VWGTKRVGGRKASLVTVQSVMKNIPDKRWIIRREGGKYILVLAASAGFILLPILPPKSSSIAQ